jgi:hypothetical protein
MKLPKEQLEPIMTNSENIIQFGPNAYAKPATGLNILRETIMGRDLFDYAFKEYARRWAFKHPTPADFFRTMEDASGEDLDWFWRGWFYGIDACDISLDSVKAYRADLTANRSTVRDTVVYRRIDPPQTNGFDDLSKIRNREDTSIRFLTDTDTTLRDFYWNYVRGNVPYDTTRNEITVSIGNESADQNTKLKFADKYFYELSFSNKGGLVMPVIVEFTYADGSKEIDRIPAQVWRRNENMVTKLFMKNKEVTAIRLDPMRETADINESNNNWPQVTTPTRFQVFKARQQVIRGQSTGSNPMQQAATKKGF